MPRTTAQSPGYRDVFAVSEYRAMFGAGVISLAGDQIAAVALAVLLYQRSGSALIAALGYAVAYLPWIVGGPLLSVYADRLPARTVMIGCDVARAALLGCAALPGLPLPVLGGLILAAALLGPPFDAASSSVLPQILDEDRYAVATSLLGAVHQGAQLAGFAAGGLLVAAVSPHGALALDAATFAVSALLLRRLRRRDAAASTVTGGLLRQAAEGLRVVAGDRRLFGPLLLAMAGSACVIVPEAIAPAYSASLGAGSAAVGLIMGAVAAGATLGSLLVGRLVNAARRCRLMWPMALAGAAPLLVAGARPGLWASLALFAVAGVGSSFQVAANTAFAMAAPAAVRGRAFGVAMTGLFGAQTLGIVAAGVAATLLPPSAVVALAGLAGAAAVLALRPVLLDSPVHRLRPRQIPVYR